MNSFKKSRYRMFPGYLHLIYIVPPFYFSIISKSCSNIPIRVSTLLSVLKKRVLTLILLVTDFNFMKKERSFG